MPSSERRPERRPRTDNDRSRSDHDRDRDRDRSAPRPVPVSVSDAERDDAAQFLAHVLQRAGWSVDVTARKEGSTLSFSIDGPDALALALDPAGLPNRRLISSFKHLLQRKLWPEDASGPIISLSVGSFNSQQDAAFTALAARLALTATQGARVEVLGMAASDRRLLHHPLGAASDIKSESQGQGIFRHLVIQAR